MIRGTLVLGDATVIASKSMTPSAKKSKVDALRNLREDVRNREVAQDALVTTTIKRTVRVLAPEHHGIFATRVAEIIGQYPTANRADRTELLARFMNIPAQLLSKPVGRALGPRMNSRQRQRQLRRQIVGTANSSPAVNQGLLHDQNFLHTQDESPHADNDERRATPYVITKSTQLARLNLRGKAAKILARKDLPMPKWEILVSMLKTLHPAGCNPPSAPFVAPMIHVDPNILLQLLKKSSRAVCPGPSGWTEELLVVAMSDPVGHRAITEIVRDIINGEVERAEVTKNTLIGIPKSDNGIRPIAMGEAITKVSGA